MMSSQVAHQGGPEDEAFDETVACDKCRRVSWDSQTGVMVGCDGCDHGWHLACAGLERVPEGDFWCPRCVGDDRPADLGPAPTFRSSLRPASDRRAKRAKAGLGVSGPPTVEEYQLLLLEGDSVNTRKKLAGIERRVLEMLRQLGLPQDCQAAFGLFGTMGVKDNLAASTLTSQIALLRRIPWLVQPPESELIRLRRAVERMAQIPRNAKLPLLPDIVERLRLVLVGANWPDDGSDASHRALRTWTFILVAFVGLFRSCELLGLTWDYVTFRWRVGQRVCESTAADVPSNATLLSVAFDLDETKTQREGARVQVKALDGPSDLGCPVRSLLRLKGKCRGSESAPVFQTSPPPTRFRKKGAAFVPTALSYDTMLGAFKAALVAAGVESPERYGLHSLRRGGATLAARRGFSMREIMTQGRWTTDVAYIYALIADDQALELTGDLAAGLKSLSRVRKVLQS